MGQPYTGVLIDGLHNVFVQFPNLEKVNSFWGIFYNILRRRRVSVVTTHTEFEIQHSVGSDGQAGSSKEDPFIFDFDQAQRKIAPLLNALVSGADYLFELSPQSNERHLRYQAVLRGSISPGYSGQAYEWDKDALRLEAVSPNQLDLRVQGIAKSAPRTSLEKAVSLLASAIINGQNLK